MARLRFTDCDKWTDPWFLDLPNDNKLFWLYLCDKCDNAGVVHLSPKHISVEMNLAIDPAVVPDWLEGRVVILPSGKWHLLKFVSFQNRNGLSPACHPHRQIIRLLESHGLGKGRLRVVEGFMDPCPRVQDKNKNKDKDQDKDQDGGGGGMFDRMDGDEIELAKPLPMRVTFKDWNFGHPKLWIARADEHGSLADWTSLYERAGVAAMDDGYTSILKLLGPGKRINYSAMLEWLAENYREEANHAH